MNKKELKDLQDKTYAISWSGFPIGDFFNDIMKNTDPNFNKESAFQDLKKIIDEIYVLREKANKYDEKETPKKPILISNQNTCPNCSEHTLRYFRKCCYCGQRLDWSDKVCHQK